MNLPHWNIIANKTFTALILLWILTATLVAAKKSKKQHLCPIGFSLAYTKHKDDPICYRLKSPESFTDRFRNCAGNLYTSKLLYSLNITIPNLVLWADYKSFYPGGPFIDWSYTESNGDLLLTTFDVKYDSSLGLDEELCVVIDPVSNFTATRCNERHFRYCFVEPYPEEDDMTDDDCELSDYWRFWSPRSTCLTTVTGVGGGTIRATWRQAQDLCDRRGGSLLQRGWRYANNPMLHEAGSNWTSPLGIVMNTRDNLLWFDPEDDNILVPDSEWNFREEEFAPENSLGTLRNGAWNLVNSSYVFFDVICERSVPFRNISMNLTVDMESKITLYVNESIDKNKIFCYTDSVIYYPTVIKTSRDDNEFVLKPITDGYYWCIHIDFRKYRLAASNNVLFIRERQSVINLYAVKIRLKKRYSFENLQKLYRNWEKKLKEYIYYRTKYIQIFGESELDDPYKNEDTLKSFKDSYPGLNLREKDVIYFTKLKRLYLDGRTALLHVQINREMYPVSPGFWDGLEVVFMKPAYYCKAFDTVPTLSLGQSIVAHGCRMHSCVGDFNEGVQWVTTAISGCTTRPPVTVESTVELEKEVSLLVPTSRRAEPTSTKAQLQNIENNTSDSSEEREDITTPLLTTEETTPCDEETTVTTTAYTMVTDPVYVTTTEYVQYVSTADTPTEEVVTISPPKPTTIPPAPTSLPPLPRPPDEQLIQVMEDLEWLVHNDSASVFVENIDEAFNQVDVLLDVKENLEIPGEFLHLLDQLGAKANLNGSHMASTIRNNIAMLMADASPESPVRGLRIAARDEEIFTNGAFEIISDEVNSTHLTADRSEAVVHLPESVSNSSRRISFVVFRTDRAFRPSHAHFAVNSRVLSINVENMTQFIPGEVIDIHLRPMTEEPGPNRSRTCAYWHFFDDGTGYWSQEGCTFIRATEPGMLDTCQCNHLTHFAEILVPRTGFSEADENALELISLIGCCLSLFGLTMVGLTAGLFRSWRRDFSNKIWLQLCIAIFILIVCFLAIVFARFNQYDVPCMLVGVLLHYSVLSSFCWMLVAAVLSYRRLVLVFTRDASHKLLRASAFSWGAPCAVVGILLSVDPHSYSGRFEESSSRGSFCYPSGLGLWLTVYAPIAAMLLANWTLFILIVRSVFASRSIQRHGDSNEALRCASVSCLLVFLFGLPWLFGLFAYNIVAAYFFNLTATFQGFVLFIFFVLGNKKTRDLWLNKLKIKQTRMVPVTSSTYTNKSTGSGGAGWRGASGGAASMEANSSKPRSLSSPDESRFS